MSKELSDGTNYSMRMLGKEVFYLTYLDGADVDLDKVKEVVENGIKLHGDKPFYSILDFRDNFASMSPDGKKYLSEQDILNRNRVCEVILVNTLAMKLIISGYFRLYKPIWPIKVYRKEYEIFDFLKEHGTKDDDLNALKSFFADKKAQKVA